MMMVRPFHSKPWNMSKQISTISCEH